MINDNELFHHRSKERIKHLGEVFTPDEFVNQMLKMLQGNSEELRFWSDESNIFFEPTCGHGNFVTALVLKRLNALHTSLKVKNPKDATLSAIANTINTLWAIDIDSKNIEECRFRVFSVIVLFWTSSENLSTKQLIKKNKNFIAHLLCAIKWHIHENEALSALADEKSAVKAASQTELGAKWIQDRKHKPIDFELTWCEYFQQCVSQGIPVSQFDRALKFVEQISSGERIRNQDEFSFALEMMADQVAKTA